MPARRRSRRHRRVSPDARDAGRLAADDRPRQPDARDPVEAHAASGSSRAIAASDRFDWLDAGIGAAGLAMLLLLGGRHRGRRATRRGTIGAA